MSEISVPVDLRATSERQEVPAVRKRRWPWLITIILGSLHVGAVWLAMGGWAEIAGPWPLAFHDHPIQFHSSTVTPSFLWQTHTTAGYDPSFMAGYPKSMIFPPSSTMFDVIAFFTSSRQPAQTYKLTVLVAVSLLPWLLAYAGSLWGLKPGEIAWATALYLLYVWTDGGGAGFPLNYALYGMVPYLLAVPLGLAATAAFCRFVKRGGFLAWEMAVILSALVFLVHVTSVMVVAPAASLALTLVRRIKLGRFLAAWLVPIIAVAVNAFWWLPGYWLASTKGESGFAFAHPESIGGRLANVALVEAPILMVLAALLVPGLIVLAKRDRLAAAGIGGTALAGFLWGYAAGASRALDFLQPGRQTYALFAAACLLGGVAIREAGVRLREGEGRLDLWFALAVIVLGVRLFGADLAVSAQRRLGWHTGAAPFLSNGSTRRLEWVISRVKDHLKPGDRLLYEEGGIDQPGVPDPFAKGRFSGLLPHFTGVEVLGGPYLHVALTTNFTQFGEGALFGDKNWTRGHFEKYARLYRPDAILCWSPWARAFCKANPDLIEVLDEDGAILLARVNGFKGDVIQGQAQVISEPGRLRVRIEAAEVDAPVVLRYHFVPYLKSRPPVRLEPVRLEGDPVPFIGLWPTKPGDLVLEMDFPPGGSDQGLNEPAEPVGGFERGPKRRPFVAQPPGRERVVPQAKPWFIFSVESYGRRAVWIAYLLTMIGAAAVYADKAADDRSAFIRWRHQVHEFWEGKNIWDDYYYPNPPIMPLTLTPLMALPPVVGALTWFALKASLTAVTVLMCLRMACPGGWRRYPFWAVGLVLLLSLRPILGDQHHGNNNLLILFLVVSALYAWRNGYDVLAGVLLALSITYKVTPALFVPYLLYKRSWKTVAATLVGIGLFLFVVPSLFLGPRWNLACLAMWWHRTISPFVVGNAGSEQEVNQSMVGVLTRFLTAAKPGGDHGYGGVSIDVSLLALNPAHVSWLIKGLCVGLVGLLALFCRTRTNRRDDARLLGEFSLVVLTMLFASERSWKHHYVTVLLPYTYLVYRVASPKVGGAARAALLASLLISTCLMASTSPEFGRLFMKQGHKIAQAYGGFFWAGVVLYVATAWRVVLEGRRPISREDHEPVEEERTSSVPRPHVQVLSSSQGEMRPPRG